MNKCLRLVVFGGLLSVAALNADEGNASTSAASAATTATSTANQAPASPAKVDAPAEASVAGFSLTAYTNKVSVQAIKDLVNKYPYQFAAGTATVVVGLALWKCSWVRKQLGLEEDESDLRSEFDFEAMMNQAKRK